MHVGKPKIHKVILKVLDLNDSVSFLEGLGLKLLRKRSNVMSTPKVIQHLEMTSHDSSLAEYFLFQEASMCAYLGQSSEDDGFVELFYPYSFDKLDLGNCFNELTISSNNAKKGQNVDPNGYKIHLI